MKIELVKKYREDQFTFDVLKKEYGIFAVRGPRGIPNSLSAALKKGWIMQISDIDNGKSFDWGNTSKDYAKYRDIYPKEFRQSS